MRRVSWLGLAATLFVTSLHAEDPSDQRESRAALRLKTLINQYVRTSGEFSRMDLSDEPQATRAEILADRATTLRRYVDRFMHLAMTCSDDSVALDALIWAATNIECGEGGPELDRTFELLRTSYLTELLVRSPLEENDIQLFWVSLGRMGTEAEQALLRVAATNSPYRWVQAGAYLSLGQSLLKSSERARQVRRMDAAERARFAKSPGGRERLAALLASDPEAQFKDAESALEQVIQEYPAVKIQAKFDGPLSELAAYILFEQRHLGVGMTAPEIEGKDIDGQGLRLGEFRGKIVVLFFWNDFALAGIDRKEQRGGCFFIPGTTRHPEVYDPERALVKRMAGKPFVLLGVNNDDDLEDLKKRIGPVRIPWRSFFDNGPTSPITRRWNGGDNESSSLYVIDARGVIRSKTAKFDGELDKLVDQLVEEAARGGDGG